MSDYLFSVIIPVYNCSGTIIRALDSISIQEYNNCEVILIDDCSPDNSAELIKEYVKSHHSYRITLISNNVNCGPAESRNKGILAAKGEYVCFLDSDDYVSNDYFLTLEQIIEKEKSDLIYFRCRHIIGNKSIISPQEYFKEKADFIALSSGALWRFAIANSLIRKYPLPNLRNAEDIAIIPLLINDAKKISFCNQILYYYIHNNSLSSTHSPRVTYNFVKSFDHTLSAINPPYHKGVEFHGIKTLLYGAILNGLKANMPQKELDVIINNFEQKFPKWINNKYIYSYPMRKKIFLRLVYKRNFILMRLYVKVHTILLKYL